MPAARIPGRELVVAAITASVQEILTQRGSPLPAIDNDSRLIGRSAILDSLGLVTLIVDLEQRLEDEFAISLSLANERAMSQAKSPFISVGSLTDYVCQQLAEADHHDQP